MQTTQIIAVATGRKKLEITAEGEMPREELKKIADKIGYEFRNPLNDTDSLDKKRRAEFDKARGLVYKMRKE